MKKTSEEAWVKQQRERNRANDGEKKQEPGEGHAIIRQHFLPGLPDMVYPIWVSEHEF
ncbi:MAG: hypothetical protein WA252_06355 [Candidatus Sulfotelmatobacter sp.]